MKVVQFSFDIKLEDDYNVDELLKKIDSHISNKEQKEVVGISQIDVTEFYKDMGIV